MKRAVCVAILLCMGFAMIVSASLRARYTVPRYHRFTYLINAPLDTIKVTKADTVKSFTATTSFTYNIPRINPKSKDTLFFRDTVFASSDDTIKYKRSIGKWRKVVFTDFTYPGTYQILVYSTDTIIKISKSAGDKIFYDVAADSSYRDTITFTAQGPTLAIRRAFRLVAKDSALSPMNHDTVGTYNGSEAIGWQRAAYMPKVETGVWANYDPVNAFENVPDSDLGDFANAPFVDSKFWLDSCFEVRSNGAYVGENVTKVLNDSAVAFEGMAVEFFGGIRFPQAGLYTVYANGDDAKTPIYIDINDDGKFNDTTESTGMRPGFTQDSLTKYNLSALMPDASSGIDADNIKSFRFIKDINITANQVGKFFKFWGFQWNHSQVSYSSVFWKRPDGKIEPVPSWAFGKRRNFGRPKAHILYVAKDSADIISVLPDTMWAKSSNKIYDSTALIIMARGDNLGGGTCKYVFEWGDNSTPDTTYNNIAAHVYKYNSAVFMVSPTVKVIRLTDNVCSDMALEAIQFVGPKRCPTGSTCPAPKNLAQAGVKMSRVHGVASQNITLQGTTLIIRHATTDMNVAVYNMAGSKVKSIGMKQNGFATVDLKRSGLSTGLYVVNVLNKGSKVRSLPVIVK